MILIFRLLHLTRIIDLERAFRALSLFQGATWLLLRRKWEQQVRWERIIRVPGEPALCPETLLLKYVELTCDKVPAGSPLLISLGAPYAPLTSNSIGRITKNALSAFGVDVSAFGAHSTRGRGWLCIKGGGYPPNKFVKLGGEKTHRHFRPTTSAWEPPKGQRKS